MRYVNARVEEEYRDMTYRFYMTDTLYYYCRSKSLQKRYSDLLAEGRQNQDLRSGEEIALDVIEKAGLTLNIEGAVDE